MYLPNYQLREQTTIIRNEKKNVNHTYDLIHIDNTKTFIDLWTRRNYSVRNGTQKFNLNILIFFVYNTMNSTVLHKKKSQMTFVVLPINGCVLNELEKIKLFSQDLQNIYLLITAR